MKSRCIKIIVWLLLCGLAMSIFFRKPSISIGDVRWVYEGDNISHIACGHDILVESGGIELNHSGHFICGLFVSHKEACSYWFVIDMRTNGVYRHRHAYLLLRELRKKLKSDDVATIDMSRLSTFQTFAQNHESVLTCWWHDICRRVAGLGE